MYAKIINGVFRPAPRHLENAEQHIYNPSAEMYASQGWKPVRFTDAPEAPEGYYYESGWSETEDEIEQTWELKKLPDEVDEAEAWNILFGEG